MSVYIQLFCERCGWEISLNESQRGSCDNVKCVRRHVVVQLVFRVFDVKPVSDSFKRTPPAQVKM